MRRKRSEETGNLDLCAAENLAPRPTNIKGNRACLTKAEKRKICDMATADSIHCRMTLTELVAATPFNISNSTMSRVLTADNLNICKPSTKPFLSAQTKEKSLIFSRKYRYLDPKNACFIDESYFESLELRRRRMRGVRRRPGEQGLPKNNKNKNIKFTNGVAVMFWGAIHMGFVEINSHTTPLHMRQKDSLQLPLYIFSSSLRRSWQNTEKVIS